MKRDQIFNEDGVPYHQVTIVRGDEPWYDEVLLPRVLDVVTSVANLQTQKPTPFTIDDARTLKQSLSETFDAGLGYRYVVYFIPQVTLPAQNALLKVLEEIPAHTYILFVTPRPDLIINTIWSRVAYVSNSQQYHDVSNAAQAQVQKFLRLKREDRIAYINKLIENYQDVSALALKGGAFRFLNALEYVLHQQRTNTHVPAYIFRCIWHAKDYLHDSGASVKLLLEEVALSVPNVRSL